MISIATVRLENVNDCVCVCVCVQTQILKVLYIVCQCYIILHTYIKDRVTTLCDTSLVNLTSLCSEL